MSKKVDNLSFTSLIKFNKIMGSIHLVQGLFMMVFAFLIFPNLDGSGTNSFTIPVIGNYLNFVEGQGLVLTLSHCVPL